jgi:hypothetical protein
MHVWIVTVTPDDQLCSHTLNDVYRQREDARAAAMARLQAMSFQNPPDRGARWFDANVVSNYTDLNGERWATLQVAEVR